MDSSLTQRRATLEEKIPDIRKTLEMVEYLQEKRVSAISFSISTLIPLRCEQLLQEGKSKASGEEEDIDDLTDAEDSQKPLKTTFELNDTLYAEAELEDSDTVFLWLGVGFGTLAQYSFMSHSKFSRPTSCCHTKSRLL